MAATLNIYLKVIRKTVLLTGIFLISSCEPENENNDLTVTPTFIEMDQHGGVDSIYISTNADSWAIEYKAASWIELSGRSGNQKENIVTLEVNSRTLTNRTDTLTVYAGNADPVKIIVKQNASDYLYSLSSSKDELIFTKEGNTEKISITTDAPLWKIKSDQPWLHINHDSGTVKSSMIEITALNNPGADARYATLTLFADFAESVLIQVEQKGDMYPNYNTSPIDPDDTGMESNAAELASKINLGWNLGNSLEAIGSETNWGNPKVTKAFIQFVKQSGFNAVRLPCSWNQYMANSSTAQLKTDWLNRIKEVVQYCVDEDMYVLLNIHWDGGWLENNCTPDKQIENNAKQKAFWEQIATHLRDFDEHLLFAGANEPSVDNASQMNVLKSYHQTFIDAVRSTGGKNAYRVLVIQGPSTDIEKTNNLMKSLPIDKIPQRMMVEVHYYTPWNFCGLTTDEDWGKMFYYWGKDNHSATDTERNPTWGEEETVDANFALMKSQFVNKGIPVILGEYSATRRSNLTGESLALHLKSRAYFLKYVTMKAQENGLIPFYWDNGHTGNDGSGIFNRNANSVADQQALDALLEGASL